jgi:hypothetical protein
MYEVFNKEQISENFFSYGLFTDANTKYNNSVSLFNFCHEEFGDNADSVFIHSVFDTEKGKYLLSAIHPFLLRGMYTFSVQI